MDTSSISVKNAIRPFNGFVERLVRRFPFNLGHTIGRNQIGLIVPHTCRTVVNGTTEINLTETVPATELGLTANTGAGNVNIFGIRIAANTRLQLSTLT